jgi:hypothetical protein
MEESGSKSGRTGRPAAKAPAAAPKKAATPRKVPAARQAAAPKAPAAPATPVDRDEMVRVAAYFRAQRRGFAPGYEVSDWLEAQAEVDALAGPGGAPKPRKTPAKKRSAD